MQSGSSSTSTQLGDLPRIDCPKCGIKVIRCKSKSNDVYYKCPNHFPDNKMCPYYWFEEPYVEYLRCNHPELLIPGHGEEQKAGAAISPEEAHGDPKLQMSELKLQMCEVKLQMCELKVQVGEVMLKVMQAKEEIKEEIAKGKKTMRDP